MNLLQPITLGVNIDHIATIRQARGTRYPDPIAAAGIAERAGADGITVHLREDRRHIQDRDVRILRETLQTRMNLEMAATAAMQDFALEIRPPLCCLVPERREELTTEGGLNVVADETRYAAVCEQLGAAGIEVSLFIDPDPDQIAAARRCGAPVVELHTGDYAEAIEPNARHEQLQRLARGAEIAQDHGLKVNDGHGLDYHNVTAVAALPQLAELNIGHSIVARAMLDGLDRAVRDMKRLILEART